LKGDANPDQRTVSGPLIERIVRRARLALVWEGVWPWLAAALGVAVAFLAVSWFGLWDALPPLGRMAGVALFALAFLAALAPLVRGRLPGRQAALSRVDRASGVAHRPATSLDDRLSPTGDDPLTRALWRAHRERMEREARLLKAGSPAPRLAARDPYALRFLLALIAVAAFAVAGSDRGARVAAAFDWTMPAAEAVSARVDAWVAPPGYTGRPPLFLTASRPGAAAAADPKAAALPESASEPIRVPQNATLVIRGAGGSVEVAAAGGAEPIDDDRRPPEGVVERRFRLVADAEARVSAAGQPDRVWRFTIIPDAPPTIRLSGPPQRNARGTSTIAYEVRDDYGVASAEARFALKPDAPSSRPAQTEEPTEKRPLYDAPKVGLSLPRARAREGQGQTPLDVSEHPWAGAEVVMTLHARDEAGQEGASDSHAMRLPARTFTKPVARALVEQRRELALDANAKPRVSSALEALALFPEQFATPSPVYLGLTTAYRRLELAVTDDQLRDVADYLWEIALRIEDGDLPEAERELRAAEEALRKALENGASEQEIAKLTQDLRQALEKFMQELAQRSQQQQQGQQAQQNPRGAQQVRPQDLRKMIDRMEEMAKSGSRDAARQALADLRNMLDNLQTAQRQQADPNSQAMQQQMDKLQDMIREQGKLRDRTFQQHRQQQRAQQSQRGQRGQQNRRQSAEQQQEQQAEMDKLAQEQQELRRKLDQMMQEMRKGQNGDQARQQGQKGEPRKGRQPGQQGQGEQQQGEGEQGQQAGRQGQGQEGEGQQGEGGQNALGEAGKSMGQARGSLGQGQTGQALDDQQKALENLRKGAQAMAEQMQQQGEGQPGQEGEGQQGMREGEQGRDDDPLGRPVRRRESDGTTTRVPGEIDAQRARRVLEELRRRLGEADRSREELDYLERLLTP
jgi:uncharacterized protein (TIGR02302 family)